MKYEAGNFIVTIIWFTNNGISKRKFKKYKDAVLWVEQNLTTYEVIVKIYGTLKSSQHKELTKNYEQ